MTLALEPPGASMRDAERGIGLRVSAGAEAGTMGEMPSVETRP